MKKLLPLLFFAALFSATAQPLMKRGNLILLRSIRTARFQRITEGKSICIQTINGKRVSGDVRLIRADTIFFHDTLVRVADIDKLYFLSEFALPDQPPFNERKPAYIAGSPGLQIICPPDSVYRNWRTYDAYLHSLNMKARKQRLDLLDPLPGKKNFLKWNITKIAHLELGISYERMIAKNLSLETEVSAIYGIPSSSFSMIPYPFFNYNGISVTLYPKYYFIPRTYVSVVFMYRYLWSYGMKSSWPLDASSTELKDQYRNDYGLSLRIGFMRRYKKTILDYFVGVGIKYITTHNIVYGFYREDSSILEWLDQDHSVRIYDKNTFWPVFNLGIKIGRAF
jgi:hypothetical protein